MLNNLTIVGRIVSDPQINETKYGNKTTNIILAVPRNFKNSEGIYETDFIPVRLWNAIVQNTTEYFRKGDLIGVRGRLQSNEDKIVVIAEKVSFLSSRKENEDE